MMIVDARLLHVYGFNLTGLDIGKSRSFGIVTRNRKLVQEAIKLFEADFSRQPYTAGSERFVVSPENSRDRLTRFLKGARRQLLIYDPQLTDDAMLAVIVARARAGVDVKIIGRVEDKWDLKAQKFPGKRLHVRAIVRDGRQAFVGSQSLRKLELENRREVGVIVNDPKVVRQIQAIFSEDWAQTPAGRKIARKQAKSSDGKAMKAADILLASAAV
jgi:cardiolipin synthase A/B